MPLFKIRLECGPKLDVLLSRFVTAFESIAKAGVDQTNSFNQLLQERGEDPPAPPQGAPTAPPQGAPTAPPQGAPTAPPQGAPTVPPQGAPTVPPQGAPTAPPQGASLPFLHPVKSR